MAVQTVVGLLSVAFLVVLCLASDESQQSVGNSLLQEAISGLDSEIKHLSEQVNYGGKCLEFCHA
jgi:hypothetical protein